MKDQFHFYVLPFVLFGLATCQELLMEPNVDRLVKKIDDAIKLTCSVSGVAVDETAELQWFDASGREVTAKTGPITVSGYGYSLSLMFAKFRNGDEGTYSCKATINGSPSEKSIAIEVFKGITIIDSPQKQRPDINTDAFIECNVATTSASVEWLYGDERPIDFSNGRYIQQKDGLVIKNISETDNGEYFCAIMVPTTGNFIQYKITIHVTIPLKSSRPATFSPAIIGKKFTMSCYASGDPKPVFTFYKDDQHLVGYRHTIDTSNGILEIHTIHATDSGNYKCVASNLKDGVRGSKTGGLVEDFVNVDVLIPPKITSVIDIKETAERQPGELICTAEGYPAPDLIWTKFGLSFFDDPSESLQGTTLEKKEEQLPGGSWRSELKLMFAALKSTDTHTYTCSATNFAGSASKNGYVVVQFKPNFDNTPYSQTYGWANHSSEVKCVANGEPATYITWSRHGEDIVANTTFQIDSKPGEGTMTSDLTISVLVDNEDWIYGDYVCSATNSHGTTLQTIIFLKARPPGQVNVILSNKLNSTSVELVIIPPTNSGGQPVLDYKVEYNLQGSSEVKTSSATKPPASSREQRFMARIVDLEADKVYTVTVSARNNVGYGTPRSLRVKTPKVRSPNPVSFTSSPSGPNPDFYILSWAKPLPRVGPIIGYMINYKKVEVTGDSESSWTVTKVLDKPIYQEAKGDVTSYRMHGLQPNTFYQAEAKAIHAFGESDARQLIFLTAKGDGTSKPVTGKPSATPPPIRAGRYRLKWISRYLSIIYPHLAINRDIF